MQLEVCSDVWHQEQQLMLRSCSRGCCIMDQPPALQVKGKAVVQVAVEYTVHHDGAIDSAWEVDARKALPAPLPKFMYWYAPAAYFVCIA